MLNTDSLYGYRDRDRQEEATPVIMAELKQMLDKHVWHGVHTSSLTPLQRSAIIRSSIFLKDKYLASGAFERFKARLVAGGNQQDKGLYDDLSSPTVATLSVLTIAAIAAAEGRKAIAIDIWGVENPYDRCVLHKIGSCGKQISIVLHVDNLMV